jgi:hypothetical protein
MYGIKWVKILEIFSYIDRLSVWMVGNRQEKKAAPSCYTAGLATAFEGFYLSWRIIRQLMPLYPLNPHHPPL